MSTDRKRVKVGHTDELSGEESRLIADINGLEIAVFRLGEEYHAVANFCVHQGGPLCEGSVTGHMNVGEDGWEWNYSEDETVIVCPWHCWRFDIKTGKNIEDDRYQVPTYDVKVDDGEIYILR